ncbi:MAG: hypothetical protein HY049_04075 [Acidobacteria bacterium]|nr:hypothetical protein [Acidobacteriota bacterium]
MTTASAPARIDLAGGTLDIWPLNLLVDRATTVNVAIDRRAWARITSIPGREHRLRAIDISVEAALDVAGRAGLARSERSRLPLHEAIVRHQAPTTALSVETESAVPAGSGLGGSSALAVALLAATAAHAGLEVDRARLGPLARDIEAGVLEIPTGTQDHLAAIHGGVTAIRYEPGETRRVPLAVEARDLESRGVLAYLGASRASARANWDMVRRALDGDAATRRGLRAIADIARSMEGALVRGDLDEAARLLAAEWNERRGLSPEVSTPDTDCALEVARRAGAAGGKICGAGGGGCLFVMGPPGARAGIAAALEGEGFRIVDFHVDSRGLSVESSPHPSHP